MKKRILSAVLSLGVLAASVCLPANAQAADIRNFKAINTYVPGQYADVPAEHTFSENVRAGYEFGIMQGYGENFGVGNSITRMASIIVACRLNCIYETGTNDIEKKYTGTTQEMYLQYAQEHGIYAEFADPSVPANRTEFAAILSSALPDEALKAINHIEENAIPDVKAADPHASEVYRLYRAGILNGSNAKGTFYPKANITRGAACAIATRMCSPDLRKAVTLADVNIPVDLTALPDYYGEAYVVVNNNVPFFTEYQIHQKEAFKTFAPLDQLGRCGTAVANIGPESLPTDRHEEAETGNPSGWHETKYHFIDGQYLYNRCHLIGYQLSGETGNKSNVMTGTRSMNTEALLPFENMTEAYIRKTDNHVYYRVTPVFEGKNLVATGILMEAWSVEDQGQGVCFNVFCYNAQPGVTIHYATGSSTDEYQAPDPVPVPNPTPTPTPNPGSNSSGAGLQLSSTPFPGYNYYVVNTNTLKFHLPGCRAVNQMYDENTAYFNGSRETLIAHGYEPCGICNS